jgi:elongation factor G
LRRGCCANELVPVLCGTALKNRGIPPVMDAIIAFLPSPDQLPPVEGMNPETETLEQREPSVKAPFCALAFKVSMMDDGRRLVFVRIYSGKLTTGSELLNVSQGIKEKVSRLFVMHSKTRQRVESASAGQIVGVLGLRKTMTGETITLPHEPIVIEPINTYEPVISQAVEPLTQRDKEKLDEALLKYAEEDPTFHVSLDDSETGQTLIKGMGELHLDIMVDRLKREFKTDVRVGKPQVVYRETIRQSVEDSEEFSRETDDEKIYGNVTIRVAPLPRGEGVQFVHKAEEEWLNDVLLEAIETGSREGTVAGPVQGYEVSDVKITFLAAAQSPGSTKPLGYRIAAATAVRKALAKANPCLLHPMMTVELTLPTENVGEVIGSINSRHGKIEDVSEKGKVSVIKAMVGLERMFGYTTELRSLTQGRGGFTMQFSHYDVE